MYTVYRFHKFLKTFTKFYCTYKDLVYKYNSTCSDLIKKGTCVFISCFYRNVIDKAKKFKPDTSRFVKSLKNPKGCDLAKNINKYN